MTTEDDFNAALDANPKDWQTRLVYADWLQERGDPRAEGYRALGVLRKRPSERGADDWFIGSENAPIYGPGRRQTHLHAQLPPDWWSLVRGGEAWSPGKSTNTWRFFSSRRAAEDAQALAFAELPPERRAELLSAKPLNPAEPIPEKTNAGSRKKPTARKPKGKKK